jgi:hypothetical protein
MQPFHTWTVCPAGERLVAAGGVFQQFSPDKPTVPFRVLPQSKQPSLANPNQMEIAPMCAFDSRLSFE